MTSSGVSVSCRKIIHVDMDAFFASVEQRDDPSLRGRPVVVGGTERRGVVAAASYEARRFGVHSAMPCARARRLCPGAVFVPPRFSAYKTASLGLRKLLAAYADEVEPLSLDEAYLDVTDDKAGTGSATVAAQEIRRQVWRDLSLTCSAGVAPLKFVAKIASDHRKPDGLTVVPPGDVLAFIHPLPVSKLWGVGPATGAMIRERLCVETVGQLAGLDPVLVARALGSRGRHLWELANGRDRRTVSRDRVRRSRGAERTFGDDVEDLGVLIERLRGLNERVCRGLAGAAARPRTVTVKVRYANFQTVTRSATLDPPTADPRRVGELAVALLQRTSAGVRPVRLIGLSLSGFRSSVPSTQLALPLV